MKKSTTHAHKWLPSPKSLSFVNSLWGIIVLNAEIVINEQQAHIVALLLVDMAKSGVQDMGDAVLCRFVGAVGKLE